MSKITNEPIEVFMCKTDFDYEIGFASGGNRVFASLEDLQDNKPCWKTCGVVKVGVLFIEEIIPEDMSDPEL